MFSTAALTSQQTVMTAGHLLETRAAVNIVRAAAGLSAAVFTDATVTGMRPRAIRVTELRAALDEAGRAAVEGVYSESDRGGHEPRLCL